MLSGKMKNKLLKHIFKKIKDGPLLQNIVLRTSE